MEWWQVLMIVMGSFFVGSVTVALSIKIMVDRACQSPVADVSKESSENDQS